MGSEQEAYFVLELSVPLLNLWTACICYPVSLVVRVMIVECCMVENGALDLHHTRYSNHIMLAIKGHLTKVDSICAVLLSIYFCFPVSAV